jgi:hypothetical protein
LGFNIVMGEVLVALDQQKAGFFCAPYHRKEMVAIARCADQAQYRSLADVGRRGVRVLANPGA